MNNLDTDKIRLYRSIRNSLIVKSAAEEEVQDTMGADTALEDAGRNLIEKTVGGPQFNEWGALGGNILSRVGGHIYDSVAHGMANSEGGIKSTIGNFLVNHKRGLSEIAGGVGHNLNNQWRAGMREENMKKLMKEKGIDPSGRKISPDEQFYRMFQLMAMANRGAQPNPYAQQQQYSHNFI